MSLDDFVGLKDMGFKNFNNVTIRGKKNEESRELDLFGIRLNRAKIVDVDLSKAVIDGQNRTLNELTFSNVRVGKAQLVEIMRETRNLEGLDLGDAVLEGVKFSGVNLQGAIVARADFNGANLRNATLGRNELERVLQTTKNLQGIIVAPNTILEGLDFSNVDLTGAKLKWLDLRGVKLGTKLQEVKFEYTIMGADQLRCFIDSGYRFFEKIKFFGDLSGISLEGLEFEACSFAQTSGVRLRGARVERCDLNITDNFSAEQIDGMVLTRSDGNIVRLDLSPPEESGGHWHLVWPLDLLTIETVGLNFSKVDLTDAVVMPFQLRDMVLKNSLVPDLSNKSSIILPVNIFTLFEGLRRDPPELSPELYSIFETITVIDYCYQTGLARGCSMPDLLDVMRQSKGNFFNPHVFPESGALNYHPEFLTPLATNDCRQDMREKTILAAAMRQMLFAALTSPRLKQESVIIKDAEALNTVFSIVSRDEWAQLNPGLRAALEAKFPEEINGHLEGTAVRPETREVDADLVAKQHAALLTYLSTYFWGTVSGDPEFGTSDLETGERISLAESTKQIKEAYKEDATVNLITLALERASEDIFLRFGELSDENAQADSYQWPIQAPSAGGVNQGIKTC